MAGPKCHLGTGQSCPKSLMQQLSGMGELETPWFPCSKENPEEPGAQSLISPVMNLQGGG